MQLDVHRESSVAQTLDEVCFPQRPVPVEQAAVQAGGQFEEVSNAARRGQRRAPHVVVQLDIVVVGPAKVADPAEHGRGMLTEGGLDMVTSQHRLIGVARESPSGARRRCENCRAATCMGCSRDSAKRCIASRGDISCTASSFR